MNAKTQRLLMRIAFWIVAAAIMLGTLIGMYNWIGPEATGINDARGFAPFFLTMLVVFGELGGALILHNTIFGEENDDNSAGKMYP